MLKQPLSIAVTAVTAVALLGTVACERDRMDTGTTPRDTTVEGTRTDETTPRAETGERLSPDMQRRFDQAHERFTRLEGQAAEARRDLAARGGEVRTDVEAGLERALTNTREKLDAARKASADNARRAMDDLDTALDDLDKRLREHGRT